MNTFFFFDSPSGTRTAKQTWWSTTCTWRTLSCWRAWRSRSSGRRSPRRRTTCWKRRSPAWTRSCVTWTRRPFPRCPFTTHDEAPERHWETWTKPNDEWNVHCFISWSHRAAEAAEESTRKGPFSPLLNKPAFLFSCVCHILACKSSVFLCVSSSELWKTKCKVMLQKNVSYSNL